MISEIHEFMIERYEKQIEEGNAIFVIDDKSILSSDLKGQYQNLKDFFEVYNIELNKKTSFIATLLLTCKIIRFIEKKEKNFINKKSIKNTIEQMNYILENLNIYENNQGYIKMKKRNELLLKQFDKYLNGDILKQSLEDFFNETTGIKLPSINNVISLFQQNIKTLMKSSLSISNQEIEEAVLNLSRNLFNKTNFSKDFRYKKIILDKNILAYKYESNIKIKKEEIFTLIKS